MPQVLSINNKPYTLFSDRDFEKILDEKLGMEAAHYFRSLVNEYEEQIETLNNSLKDSVSELKELNKSLENQIAEMESNFYDE